MIIRLGFFLFLCVSSSAAFSRLPTPAFRQLKVRHRASSSMISLKGSPNEQTTDPSIHNIGRRESMLPASGYATRVHTVIGSTAREVVSLSVAIALLFRRDSASILWVVGAIATAALSKVLKRVINESRPPGAQTEDPGMPSSHAMSLFFQAKPPPVIALGGVAVVRAAAAAGVGIYAFLASSWRVLAGYHTPLQVTAGACAGSASGLAWYVFSRRVLSSAVGIFLGSNEKLISLGPTLALIFAGGSVVRFRLRKVRGTP